MTKKVCSLCPRECNIDRSINVGYCNSKDKIKVARAQKHMWEEPCISGTNGSGTVFFTGCNMGCVFCQNAPISKGNVGKEITVARLKEIYATLIESKVHNINLVTPSHYVDKIVESLDGGLPIPVVYNSSGYDKVSSLEKLRGKIDIYLPDFKYSLDDVAMRYSSAKDYPRIVRENLEEMYSQVGDYVINDDGIMEKGMIVRHLVLPSNYENSKGVIDTFSDFIKGKRVLFSLMSQYTPVGNLENFPEIARKLTRQEYERVEEYMLSKGIEEGFCQDYSSADEIYIPPFNLEGV